MVWLHEHPQNDPWSPLYLADPPGWATKKKLVAARTDASICHAVLERSDVPFEKLAAAGAGECRRTDLTILPLSPLSPATPAVACPVAIGLEYWLMHTVDPAAQEVFGAKIARIDHLGAYSCRRLYGRSEGAWSEHATANAIDIAAFVLDDGTRISVLHDWNGDAAQRDFLKRVRDGACYSFATVLSPDYNQAHRDHLHLDQARRWSGVCR